LARSEYEMIALEELFDTAHLLRLFDFTADVDKFPHSHLERVTKRSERNEQP
jgi:hypothetical protein